MVKDSGNRRQFQSGAVRDMQEGKGRCDLLPLGVINNIIEQQPQTLSTFLNHVYSFQLSGVTLSLIRAFWAFVAEAEMGNIYDAILQLSIHYEEGAKKYTEWNWTKGIPLQSFIDSAVRHYLKYKAGLKDEAHDRAVLWNLAGAIWTVLNRPDYLLVLDKDKGYITYEEAKKLKEERSKEGVE